MNQDFSLCETCIYREDIKIKIKKNNKNYCICGVSKIDLTYPIHQCTFFNLDPEKQLQHINLLNGYYKKSFRKDLII
jgi:hypothetical protein